MAISVKWERVKTNNGSGFDAYVVRAAKENGQAIVVLQEIFGINEALRELANSIAEQGYLVAVPDLFWRMQPHVDLGYDKESVKKAFSYLEHFDERFAVEDIAATVCQIRTISPEVKFIHLVGFCLGGKLAVLGADDRNVTSAISFYGVGIEKDLAALARAKCPLQLHFGGQDKFVPSSAVAEIKQASSGLNIEIHIYPDANHGFFSTKRQSYDPIAADTAWKRSLALMQRAMSK